VHFKLGLHFGKGDKNRSAAYKLTNFPKKAGDLPSEKTCFCHIYAEKTSIPRCLRR
jgi:hypothetical protein